MRGSSPASDLASVFPAHCARRGRTTRFSAPRTYTPEHLAERILTSKAALQGERKLVTILFADLKGSMVTHHHIGCHAAACGFRKF